MVKSIIVVLITCLFISCNFSDSEYTLDNQIIIDGKVSAKRASSRGYKIIYPPVIWVQSDKQTREVTIPLELENNWNVGDSCLLIIEKYSREYKEPGTSNK